MSVEIVLVGCGAPLRSMGWYHATQILHPGCNIAATLSYIVEPYYMSVAGKTSPGSTEFNDFKKDLETNHGIKFFSRVQDVPPVDKDGVTKRLAIISARTSDNPTLFASCLSIGCRAIFLEKPGAPSVEELEIMKNNAQEMGVDVYMGFNKNVSKYQNKAREYAKNHQGMNVTFLHNNNYDEADLPECFERNSEGMLKNMAIHELALAVTFYGVSVAGIASVEADKAFSSCKTLKGPSSGQKFTDFSRLKFTITTKDGNKVSIAADRCGGDDSVGIITDNEGKELMRFTMPDDEDAGTIKEAEQLILGAMPYFYVQSPDYQTLKQRVAKAVASGLASDAEGVATIDVALETLKIAEHLTPILIEQLK